LKIIIESLLVIKERIPQLSIPFSSGSASQIDDFPLISHLYAAGFIHIGASPAPILIVLGES